MEGVDIFSGGLVGWLLLDREVVEDCGVGWYNKVWRGREVKSILGIGID